MIHVFIVNPAAGKGRSLSAIPLVKAIFEGNTFDYKIEITGYPGHATQIAAKYAAIGDCRVYSVGGDGTLNEVLNGIAGTSCSLAVIPCGSGNDFIRSLPGGICEDKDLFNIINRTVNGVEKPVDLGKVNERFFINIASIGFDALVAFNTMKLKRLPLISGSMAYVLGIFITLLRYSSYSLQICNDGKTINMKALLVAVANGRYYGGGMLATPQAMIDDGQFELCLIEHMSRPMILRFFPKFIKGAHGEIKGVSFDKGKKVEITSQRPVVLNIDGELTVINRVVFEIIERGILVVVPDQTK